MRRQDQSIAYKLYQEKHFHGKLVPMIFDISPQHSKTRINQAGDKVRAGTHTLEDNRVIENWRASHAHILNTFQATLRGRSRGKSITVAQRLKRRITIFDKLVREQGMQLSRMNDVAGCRLIFENQENLNQFRSSLHTARFKHKLRNGNDDRYNYIKTPKTSGYRGIHDVYQYKGPAVHGSHWDGLLLEIQYRTTFQHSWATAVEIADFIDSTRIKFGDSDQAHRDFFQLASELIARYFENQFSARPDLTNIQLVDEFNDIDRKIGLIETFKGLRKTEGIVGATENAILIIHSGKDGKMENLEVLTFQSMSSAISRYEELERQYAETNADIVLVRAGSTESIRDAFRNYFSDVVDFVQLIDESRKHLPHRPALQQP